MSPIVCTMTSAILVLLLVALASADEAIIYNGNCSYAPNTNKDLTMAGSSLASVVASIWSEQYPCPSLTSSNIQGGGSTLGAERVCAKTVVVSAVDMAGTLRQLTVETEVRHEAGFLTNTGQGRCNFPSPANRRRLREIEVGYDAGSLVVATNSDAHMCIDALGGLTADQLRWIFSSSSTTPSADVAPNYRIPERTSASDSRFWSDLSADPRCKATEIQLFGPDRFSSLYDSFTRLVGMDVGETIVKSRLSGMTYFADINGVVVSNAVVGSCSGIGLRQFTNTADTRLYHVPIQTAFTGGAFVAPTESSIRDRTYPLASTIYVQVYYSYLHAPGVLNLILPSPRQLQARDFLQFGLSDTGTNLLLSADLVTLDVPRRRLMLCRLDYKEYCDNP